MSRTIHAIFEDGVFKPTEPVDLPPHAAVLVTVDEGAGAEYKGSLPRKFALAGIGEGPEDFAERAEDLLEGFGED